jgi:hypothetical protein
MTKLTFSNVNDIPAAWGNFLLGRKKTTVKIREPQSPSEQFKLSWGDLVGVPGTDVVIYTDKDPKGYPCKIDIFKATYLETAPGSGLYLKTETSKLVLVPADTEVILKTLEGDIVVPSGHYVVVGKKGEVYANKPEWVAENLDIVGEAERS